MEDRTLNFSGFKSLESEKTYVFSLNRSKNCILNYD